VPQDAQILGQYFLGLSDATQQLYGPHPFDQATADALCAQIDYADTIRLIATIGAGDGEQVIAYFILILGAREEEQERYNSLGLPLDSRTDCTLAPSVADAFQNQGVGSAMMRHLILVARRLGRRRMVLFGGTYATNHRAIHFYQKYGFGKVGTFEHPQGVYNHDMLLELASIE
jgi:GNAT superfamily N-acetyltransferase